MIFIVYIVAIYILIGILLSMLLSVLSVFYLDSTNKNDVDDFNFVRLNMPLNWLPMMINYIFSGKVYKHRNN
jgi:K+-sensing histidine kinase KdpD